MPTVHQIKKRKMIKPKRGIDGKNQTGGLGHLSPFVAVELSLSPLSSLSFQTEREGGISQFMEKQEVDKSYPQFLAPR